jgi:hypothetical protein
MTSRDKLHHDLNQFASMVWGHSHTVLKHHPGGFEFIDFGGSLDAFQDLFGNISVHDKLLVRHEYRVTYQALQTDVYRRGAYVSGQPGIGTSWKTNNSNLNDLSHAAARKNPLPHLFTRSTSRRETGCHIAIFGWHIFLRTLQGHRHCPLAGRRTSTL